MTEKGDKRTHRRRNFKEYTKVAVKWLLVYGCIASSFPYVLSMLGHDPVSTLGEKWLIAVVAVILGYMLKAAFGKYNEEKTRIRDRELDLAEEQSCDLETDYVEENGGIKG